MSEPRSPHSGTEVSVLVVTHNEADDLLACLTAVRAQDHRPLSLVVVDCASHDASVAIARAAELGDVPKMVIEAGANLGFAGGMNLGLRHTDAPYVLTLNADVRLERHYIARLLEHLRDPARRIAAATGRLLRFAEPGAGDRIDACGMRLTRSWRHLDRGADDQDHGQYARSERVFGATGAAALFARAALDDVRFPPQLAPGYPEGAVFDPDFFAFREDAELCFRLQSRGWHVIYEPSAHARHRRLNLPKRRRAMPARINLHGVKNRFLLRAYHQTLANALRHALPTLTRDLLVLGYVLIRERSSLDAFAWLWCHRRTILARRRHIRRRRTTGVEVWFRTQALPLDDSGGQRQEAPALGPREPGRRQP